ncbi:lysozyme [bacterium]|nr:lysozyme [bacterium]
MANIPLPGKNLIQGYSSGGEGSVAAAAAPWAATANLGREIQDTGDQYTALLAQAQKAQTRTKSNEMELELLKIHADYENEMLKSPNPSQWVAGYEKKMAEAKKRFVPDNMTPDEQEAIGGAFNNFATRSSISVGRTAAVAVFQNDKLALGNLLTQAEASDDEELRQRGLSQTREMMPAAEADKVAAESDRRVASTRVTREIEADPLAWKDKLKDPEVIKEFPGLAVGDLPRLQDMARAAARQSVGDALDQFNDSLATGAVKSPEEIDRSFKGRVSPSVLEDMKGTLAKRWTAEETALRKSPAYQAEMVGKISSSMAGLADAEDFEKRYATSSFMIDSLEDSPMKRQLTEQLRATKSGREWEVKTHADAAMKALDDAAKAGRFGVVPSTKKMLVADALQAGFLNAPEKLKSLGYSDDQIAKITKEDSNEKRQLAFRQEWTKRGKADPNVSQTVWQTAMAIRTGANEVMNPEAEDAAISAQLVADRRHGEAKMKLGEFLRLNPEASPDQIDTKILEIGGEQTHRELKSGIYDMKKSTSGGPNGASDSTASVPVGNTLTEIVKNFEAGGAPGGFHRSAYWDYGQWSIGYGTKAKEGETITQAQADKRLADELGQHRARVTAEAGKLGLKFNDAQLDALTSFDFNTGKIETLLANGTRSPQQIADTMLLYRNADGQRLRGLESRRKAERHLFLHGHASTDTQNS